MNPEVMRQCWLEIQPHRLFVALLVIGIILAVGNDDIGVYLFILITVMWGMRKAISSLSDEVRSKTWDTQRMSSLGAWDMTVGKLFGGTMMVWICLIPCIIYSAVHTKSPIESLVTLFQYVLGAIVIMASGLISYLICMRNDNEDGVTLAQIFGLIAGLITLSWILPTLLASAQSARHAKGRTYSILSADEVLWGGYGVDYSLFIALTLLMLAAWAVFCVYRLMRDELQYESWPIALPLFGVWATLYMFGFDAMRMDNEPLTLAKLAVITFAAMTYCSLSNDRSDLLKYRKIARSFANREWGPMLAQIPAWLPVLLIAMTAAAASEILQPTMPGIMMGRNNIWIIPDAKMIEAYNHLGVIALLIRDVIIFNYISINNNRAQTNKKMAIYGAILYIIIPGVLVISKPPFDILAAFWPFFPSSSLLAFAQAIIMAILLFIRIGRMRRSSQAI